MTGVIPGDDCARRRCIHNGGTTLESSSAVAIAAVSDCRCTQRPTFCPYANNHHSFSRKLSNKVHREDLDENLSIAAKIAKERLDERLRRHRKANTPRCDLQRQENARRVFSMHYSQADCICSKNAPDRIEKKIRKGKHGHHLSSILTSWYKSLCTCVSGAP